MDDIDGAPMGDEDLDGAPLTSLVRCFATRKYHSATNHFIYSLLGSCSRDILPIASKYVLHTQVGVPAADSDDEDLDGTPL